VWVLGSDFVLCVVQFVPGLGEFVLCVCERLVWVLESEFVLCVGEY